MIDTIRPIRPSRQSSATGADYVDTLVVVPDEVLRIVPFAAFYDGSGFLGLDRYATAIAPSLKLVEPKPLADSGTASCSGFKVSRGYVDLPNVQKEVASVHSIEGGDVLLNDFLYSVAVCERPQERAIQHRAHRLPRCLAPIPVKASCSRLMVR
jgi:CHAT domain-containing protein